MFAAYGRCRAVCRLRALSRLARHLVGPLGDMVFQFLRRHFAPAGGHAPAHRNAGLLDGFRAARNQRMPPVKVAPLVSRR